MSHRHHVVTAKAAKAIPLPGLTGGEEIQECIAACVARHASCIQTLFHCPSAAGSTARDLRCAEACACCAGMLHQAHAVLDRRALNDGW